jgi:hypothetical protein
VLFLNFKDLGRKECTIADFSRLKRGQGVAGKLSCCLQY